MIIPISYEDIIKILGKFLDDNSGLSPERILNATSVRGTDLSELISSTEMYSPSVSDSFLLFELLEDVNGEHYVTSVSETKMMTIQSYNFHIKIYGNSSPTDAQKISTIFKTASLVVDLRNKGLYVNGVSPIEPINEFINNTYILRRDLIIKIQMRYEFEHEDDEGYFNEVSEVVTELVERV